MEVSHAVWISIPEHSALRFRVGVSRKRGARNHHRNDLDSVGVVLPMEIYSSAIVR
jgi:hypothetical protein